MSSTPETGGSATSHAYPEVRFRELFEQAPVSLQILDPDGYTLRVNRAWETLWHIYEGSELKRFVLSRDYNVLRDPQLLAAGISAYLARAMAGESVEIPAIHYDTADTAALGQPGWRRWVTARAHPIKDGEGRVVEVMLMHEDISARIEAETALREREERFRSLAMATSQIIWSAAADGQILEDSPSWRAFTGQSYEEGRGYGWLDAVHPDDRERTCRVWAAAIAGRSAYETEYRVRRADGVYRWTAVKAIPMLDAGGSVREWVGANRDIHDSVMQQEGLARRLDIEQRQSALLAKVASAAQSLHTALSSEDIANVLAQEAGAILGAGQVQVSLDETGADMPAAPAGCLMAPLVDRKGRHIGQVRVAGKAAGDFDAQDTAVLAQLAAIAATGFANAQLYGSLREQDRRKDEFLAMLAHELRNPLAPIAAAAELLRRGSSPERIRASSEVIARQVRHMTSLVNDLLDVSRVTRGLIKLDRTMVGIGPVLASAVEQSRPLLASRGHELAVEVAPDLAAAQVHGDATRLVQVIANLLNNAAKYTPSRGAVALRATRDGARVRLCVIDNGIGIEAGLLPQVFDLFTQAERTPDRSQGGLGIGLALVRTMVALHGGEVHAHSDGPGKGSTFTVWLPLA
ncbi:PAS domain-containing sensor histidine kinase [Massilia sp. LjRoot122]|uniref:sensor histidine kinase n=1 Tax=Massilia sp. LjRoot122 TaxID=3342257 RepID=UPI003ECDA7DB